MEAVGIVAEYNPFHSGHAWHIAETRRRLGEKKTVVCVMSGNWVQRGECALTDKWTRAEMALHGGADLILELPLPWAISSAEQFARGGVETLKATGVVDTISFGSESGKSEDLCLLAEGMEGNDFQTFLREELDKGISFPDARQRAAYKVVGDRAAFLTGSNDNLGVEYIKAAGKDLKILAIPRQGVSHDENRPVEGFASASYLRERIRREQMAEAEKWLGDEGLSLLQGAGIGSMAYIERAMLARLRQMKPEDFACLPDSGKAEGLPERLAKAAERAQSLEEFYALAKTRRYTHSRIRRLSLWAFLGLTETDRPAEPAYLRVLGANEEGLTLLREMKERASLPVLTKPAHVYKFSEAAQRLFETECRGTDLFGLCFNSIKPCGMDYTTGPVLL